MGSLYLPTNRWTEKDWPRESGWLEVGTDCTQLEYDIVRRSALDDGICETPIGSNRGIRLDKYLRRAGVPESLILSGRGWWCAAWAGAVLADCGALVPHDYASCDSWLPYLVKEPRIGACVLYGVHGDAHHIGIVTRLNPYTLTREGNRGYAGSTNNGQAVDQNRMQRTDILGYFHARAAA